MKLLKRFLIMLQFYTRIPLPFDFGATGEDYGKGLALAPLVGGVIGLLCALVYRGAAFVAEGLFAAVCAVVFYCCVSGALHIDGLADTFDGVFSNRSREETLEIMKDSRVGTFGMVATFSVLLLDVACLSVLPTAAGVAACFAMPVLGRFASCMACGISSYARHDGMGKSFMEYCRPYHVVVAAVLALILCGPLGLTALWGLLGAAATTALFVLSMHKKLGGMTGDTAGAACELSQTVVLFLFVILSKWG